MSHDVETRYKTLEKYSTDNSASGLQLSMNTEYFDPNYGMYTNKKAFFLQNK